MEIKVVDVQSHVFPKDYAELLCKSKSKVRGTKITENKYAVDYFNGMYKTNINLFQMRYKISYVYVTTKILYYYKISCRYFN